MLLVDGEEVGPPHQLVDGEEVGPPHLQSSSNQDHRTVLHPRQKVHLGRIKSTLVMDIDVIHIYERTNAISPL